MIILGLHSKAQNRKAVLSGGLPFNQAIGLSNPSNLGVGGSPDIWWNSGSSLSASVTVTPAGAISNGNHGSGNSHPIMNPGISLPFILRII